MVLEVLVDYTHKSVENSQVFPKENFYNSVKALVTSNDVCFIKIANKLIGETIDLTSKANSEIITSIINILKILAEFLQTLKKRRDGDEEVK